MTGAELPDWAWWPSAGPSAVRNLFAAPRGPAATHMPIALRQARSLHRDERLDESASAYRAAIAELHDEHGADAPLTLGARVGLANVLLDVGDLLAAAGEALAVLERAERDLPPGHAVILAARRVHARAMLGHGLFDHAEPTLRDLLKECDQRLGPGHRLTLRVRGDLAALRADGEPAGAATEYAALIDAATRALGPKDEDVLGLRLDDAVRLARNGRVQTAIPGLERLLDVQAGTLGRSHRQTILARLHLSDALLRIGRADEAELECREVVRRWRQRYGAADPRTLAARDHLVRCLCARRAFRLAERECAAVVSERCARFGAEHPTTLRTRLRLVTILRGCEEGDAAGRQLGEIERIARDRLARPDHSGPAGGRLPMELRRDRTPDYPDILAGVRAITATRPGVHDF